MRYEGIIIVFGGSTNNSIFPCRHKEKAHENHKDTAQSTNSGHKQAQAHALTEVGIEILPTGVVVEGPVQMGVAADDAHNVRLLIGGEGLRPGGHLDLEGGVCGDDAVGGGAVGGGGGGRLGVGSGISG